MKEDIVPLAQFFLRKKTTKTLTERAKAALRAYDWPYEIRSLKNLMEHPDVFNGSPLSSEIDIDDIRKVAPELGHTSAPIPPSRVITEEQVIAVCIAQSGNLTRAARILYSGVDAIVDPKKDDANRKKLAKYLREHEQVNNMIPKAKRGRPPLAL